MSSFCATSPTMPCVPGCVRATASTRSRVRATKATRAPRPRARGRARARGRRAAGDGDAHAVEVRVAVAIACHVSELASSMTADRSEVATSRLRASGQERTCPDRTGQETDLPFVDQARDRFSCEREQAALGGERHGLRAVLGAELVEDRGHVELDGSLRDGERLAQSGGSRDRRRPGAARRARGRSAGRVRPRG